MENKRTALDILFQEIKESKAVMPDALFGYFEMVYNKAKETKQMIKFAQIVLDKAECSHTGMVYLDGDIEDIYNQTYKQQDNEDNN